MGYLYSCMAAFLMMLIVTPILRKLAFKIDYVEKPKFHEERKVHKEPKPYLAAVGIFISFWLAHFFFVPMEHRQRGMIFLSSLLIFAIGMVDDWFKIKGQDLSALPKLIVQLSACLILYLSGIVITGFTNPLDGHFILLPQWIQFLLTILWLFGVTTVINFTDGLDGLAGGISCISATTLFVVALAKGQLVSAMMSITLVGVTLGYLKFNKFPAKILMGDAGATFIGFMLGVISLEGAFKQATLFSIFIPVLALGLPIFDNLFVVFKRLKQGKPIYIADASQAHFRLIANGLSQQQAVYFLYLVSICFNLSAIILLLLHL